MYDQQRKNNIFISILILRHMRYTVFIQFFIIQLNLAISNSVNSNTPLFRTQMDFPSSVLSVIYYWQERIRAAIGYFEPLLFRTFYFP